MNRKTILLALVSVSVCIFLGMNLISSGKSGFIEKNIVGEETEAVPNVRLHPSAVIQQNGVDITRDPNNANLLFATAMTTINGGSSFINAGVYVSTNGGVTWSGSDTLNSPKLDDMRGYPVPLIDKNGRFYVTHITSANNFGSVTGVGVNYSTDRGLTWSSTVQIVNDISADRSTSCTDDSPLSQYYGNLYAVWNSTSSTPATGRFSRTTDGGVTWSTPIQLNPGSTQRNATGHDIVTGTDGSIYAVWAMAQTTSPFTEDFLGFARSTNGGSSFTVNESAIDINGIRATSYNGWGISVNGFPRMAVDKSSGPRRGWIYVVTSQRALAPAGNDADIVLYRSTDNGSSWLPGIRVNQDGLNNGKVQFYPAVCVDDGGILHVAYYDNRAFLSTGDSCSVFLSSSLDGGSTWLENEVADHHFRPRQAVNFTGGFWGEYIGITPSQGKVVVTWMDDKGGAQGFYNVWSGSYQPVTYPLNAFDLRNPSAGSTIVSLANSTSTVTVEWDTSASTATYKWIFGSPTTTPRLMTIPATTNFLTVTLGQLDNLLAGLGVPQGGEITGQWDVWAFRNNQQNDSLKSSNGPRQITFRRGVPQLTPFTLNSPPSGTTILTSPFNNSNININWNRSGQGVRYTWKFGSPDLGNVRLISPSNNSGFDTTITIVNRVLDAFLLSSGLNPGDSLAGQWSVWAHAGSDSLRASNVFNLTLKRQTRGDVLIVYDSTTSASRISRDSVIANFNALGVSYDLYNRGVNVNNASISYRGFKRVLLLGEGSSVMSNAVKDSLKSYLQWGTSTQKAKLMIMAEDIGYHLDRPASVYYDPDFARNWIGFEYASDFPGSSGGKGIVGALANPNMPDSTVGPRPDVLRKSASVPAYELHELYRFRGTLQISGLGRIGDTYNVSVMAIDVESLRRATDSPPGSPVRRLLKSSLDFVDGLLTVSVTNIGNTIPDRYSVSQNFPNPFNPETSIEFSIPENSHVKLTVFDVLGREVTTLLDGQTSAGSYRAVFNASQLPSGIYFYRIDAKSVSGALGLAETRRMILLK